MPMLLLIYILNANSFSVVFLMAMIFGWLGDIGIKFSVVVGMLLFGVEHIFYTVYLLGSLSGFNILMALPIILVLTVILVFLYRKLRCYASSNMRIPVLCYSIILCIMTFSCIYKFVDAMNISNLLLMFGGILFMISDSILSFEIFKKETKLGGFMVMLTYILAQVLITSGCM